MHTTYRSLRALIVVAALSLPGVAAAINVPLGTDDATLNVGMLIQPQGQLVFSGAPDGSSPSTDFFLRRARVIVSGTYEKWFSFFAETDAPNFGKAGVYTGQFFVQDAFMSFNLGYEQHIDVGMMLIPFSHNGSQGAATLDALDYHATLLKYPQSKVLRDTGVMYRGMVIDKLLAYRLALFTGVWGHNAAAATATEPAALAVNLHQNPEVVGQLRLQLMGSEDNFFLSGITFDKRLLSVGVSAKYQPDAVAFAAGPHSDLGFSADVFMDFPFFANQEVVGQAAYYHYDQGANQGTTGNGFFAELGYRYGIIEPIVGYDYYDADVETAAGYRAIHAGVNVWIKRHSVNVKAEYTSIHQFNPAEGSGVVNEVTAQAQFYF